MKFTDFLKKDNMFKGIMAVLVVGLMVSFASCSEDDEETTPEPPKKEYLGDWIKQIDDTNRDYLSLTEDSYTFKPQGFHVDYNAWLAMYKVYGTLTESSDDLDIVLTSVEVPNANQTGYDVVNAGDATWGPTLKYLGLEATFTASYSVTDDELTFTVGGESAVYQLK